MAHYLFFKYSIPQYRIPDLIFTEDSHTNEVKTAYTQTVSSMFVGMENDSQRQLAAAYSDLDTNLDILSRLEVPLPIPVAARTKAWACGRSLPGNVGSNAAGGGMEVCQLRVLCVVR